MRKSFMDEMKWAKKKKYVIIKPKRYYYAMQMKLLSIRKLSLDLTV